MTTVYAMKGMVILVIPYFLNTPLERFFEFPFLLAAV